MKLNRCVSLTTRSLTGTWYRAIQLKFWQSLLATAHTATIPGRFNAGNVATPGFEILYFGEDYHVALFEVQAMLGSLYPPAASMSNPHGAWALINVQVRLSTITDLTRSSERTRIGTNVQELTGDWRGYLLRNPRSNAIVGAPYYTSVPTQRLGHELHNIPRLEGFLTYSAKVPTKKNLAVFPQKLQAGNFIRFDNPITGQTHTIS